MTDQPPPFDFPEPPPPPEGFGEPAVPPPAPQPGQTPPPAGQGPPPGQLAGPPPTPSGQPPAGYQQQPHQQPQYHPPGPQPPGYQQPGSPPAPYQRTPEEEARRAKNQHTVILVIVCVVASLIVLFFVGCARACMGCSDAIKTISKNSVKVKDWGWKDGSGPADVPGSHYLWSPTKAYQDTAPADLAKDAQSKKNLEAIYAGVNLYKTRTGSYPSVIGPGTEMAQYVTPWPTDPWTGLPMTTGSHRGCYTYSTYNDALTLIVYLSP